MSLYRLVIDFEAEPAPIEVMTANVREYLKDPSRWRGVSLGMVEAAPDGFSPRQLVNDWLSSIDAQALEKMALELMGGFGGAQSTGEGFIAALRQDAATLP